MNIGIWVAMGISLLDLVLSFRSSVPGRRSVRRVCSKVAFHCGMVSFATGLTRWVDTSRSSAFLTFCIVCVGPAGNFIVAVRVRLTTIIVVVNVSTIRVSSGLVFLSFEWKALDPIVTWLFCNGGKLLWAFLSFVMWLVASQCLSAVQLGLPNHSILIPFESARQFICMCHSPNAPGWLISSGREAFWHIWIARWLLERQHLMRLSLVSRACLENQLTSALPDWRPVVDTCVSLYPLTEFSCIFYETQSEFLPKSLCCGWWCFWCFVVHHHAWESGSSLLYPLLSVDFEFSNLFWRDLQTVQNPLTSHWRWALPLWRFGQFRDSVYVNVEFDWITVRRQLWKGQQYLVCFNCRRGVFTEKLWLICRARLLLFSWRSSNGSVGNPFLDSCHHVMGLFQLWTIQITRVKRREHRFGTVIVWERS